MTAFPLRRCEAALGPGVTRLGAAATAIGFAALVAAQGVVGGAHLAGTLAILSANRRVAQRMNGFSMAR